MSAFYERPDVKELLEIAENLAPSEREYFNALLLKLEALAPEQLPSIMPALRLLAECLRSMRQRLDSEVSLRERFASLSTRWEQCANELEAQIAGLQHCHRHESLLLQGEIDEAELKAKALAFDRDIWRTQAEQLKQRLRTLEGQD